jgi:hypothetical protein
MIAYIVTKNSFDAQIIATVLPKDWLKQVEIIPAGDLYGVKSFASSLASSFQLPIVIVFDADSLDRRKIEHRRRDIQEIVEFNNAKIPVEVILGVPQMEIIFFENNSLLPRILGYEPAQELLLLAKTEPRKVLEKLLSESNKVSDRLKIIDLLTSDDIAALRQTSLFQELIESLQFVGLPKTDAEIDLSRV